MNQIVFSSPQPFFHRCDCLPNGVKVVTIETPYLHSALVSVNVRLGSRHETFEINGATHFLEHVLFRGSENFPDSKEVNGLIDDGGGSLNGMTMRDRCAFDTPIHPSQLSLAVKVLGDMVSRPLFQGVELEREIILEEMLDEVDAEGRDIDVSNLSMKLVYGDHPLGQKVAGTTDRVRALTLNDLRRHHACHFNGSSTVVAVAGPVRWQDVLPLVAENFSNLPCGALPSESAPVLLPCGPAFHLVDLEESQTDLLLSFPCPPETHPDYPALAMIRAILDDSVTSWLQREIVEDRGLAYSVRGEMELFADAGTFDVEATCTPAKVVPLVDAVLSIFQKLATELVPQSELDRILVRRRIGQEFYRDDLNALVTCFGAVELFHPPESFEQSLVTLAKVTPSEILEVARRIFSYERLHLCAVGPKIGRSKKALAELARKRLRHLT